MKFEGFRVTNFRNVIDSGWIAANQITAFVGQNEAGKSNLFEALHCLNPIDDTTYDLDEDWPVDQWEGRKDAKGKLALLWQKCRRAGSERASAVRALQWWRA